MGNALWMSSGDEEDWRSSTTSHSFMEGYANNSQSSDDEELVPSLCFLCYYAIKGLVI